VSRIDVDDDEDGDDDDDDEVAVGILQPFLRPFHALRNYLASFAD